MVRNRGKKALYEVMSKARAKSESGNLVEHLPPQKPQDTPAVKQENIAEVPKSTAKWWRKPRIIQVNAGRIEFSMPYQIAVVMLLGFIFVIIAAYRLGQSSYPAQQQAGLSSTTLHEIDNGTPIEQQPTENITQQAALPEETTADKEVEVIEPINPSGTNVIVLVQYHTLADLAPVQAHFAEYGIELEIDPQGGKYFLQTKQLYDNPANSGTDGYKALQKIKEVGKQYKAPAGYETFASNLFQDAYGKKVK